MKEEREGRSGGREGGREEEGRKRALSAKAYNFSMEKIIKVKRNPWSSSIGIS